MRKTRLPYKLFDVVLRGFEEDENESEEDESEEENESEEDKEKNKEGEDGGNIDGLKNALRRERAAAKKAQKDLKAAQKRIDDMDSKEKSETDKAKEDASKAESKAQKLASKLLTSAVDNAVIKHAQKLKFRDIDDALKLVDRTEIDVEQDEDDPGEIDLNDESVVSALKALAKAKPHLIVAEGQEDKSGSKFGGGRQKSQKEMDDAELKAKYPALGLS